MRKEEFAEVFGDINERYVKEAETVKPAKKSLRRRWGAAAACLCLMIGLALPLLNHAPSDQSDPIGSDRVNDPVYGVVAYTAPASYESAELYIATTTDLAEYDAHMAERVGEKFRGKGIRVFTFIEGTAAEECNVWYFDYEGSGISRIYYTAKSDDRWLTAWSEADELGKAIEALASETSPDTPMYLVQDQEIIYAVIGKTAYYLPGTVIKPEVSQLPAIDTEGLDIHTILLLN